MNEDLSLVSIIVPVYNIENYIKRCVNSILAQTYKNFELILIDDGSIDNSGIICDSLKLLDNRIKVIHQKNLGLSAARNLGLDISTGSYISFVDGDDYIHPQMIEILLGELKKTSSEIAVCGFERVTNDVNFENIQNYDVETLLGRDILNKFFDSSNDFDLNVSWNKIYLKCLFEDLRFPLGRYHEDNATTYKLLDKSSSVIVIHCDLYFYFVRQNSITNSQMDLKRVEDIIWGYKERIYYFETKNDFVLEAYIQVLYNIGALFFDDYIDNLKQLLIVSRFGKQILKSLKHIPFENKPVYVLALNFPRLYYVYKKIFKKKC